MFIHTKKNNFLIICSNENLIHLGVSIGLESLDALMRAAAFATRYCSILRFAVPDADNKTPAKGSTQGCGSKAACSLGAACYLVGPNAKGQKLTPAPWPKRTHACAEALLAFAEAA